MIFLKTHKIEILVGLLTNFTFQIIIMLWSKGSIWGLEILKGAYYLVLAEMSTFQLVAGLMGALLGALLGMFSSVVVFFAKRIIRRKKGNKITFFKNIESYKKVLTGLLITDIIICGLMFIVFIVYIIVPASIYGKYQQNLTEIRPYITEDESKQIQSKWVQIRNKKDYQEICMRIEKIKQKNELK